MLDDKRGIINSLLGQTGTKEKKSKNMSHIKKQTKRQKILQASFGPKASEDVARTLSSTQWNRPGVQSKIGQHASADVRRWQTAPKPRVELGYGKDKSAALAASFRL